MSIFENAPAELLEVELNRDDKNQSWQLCRAKPNGRFTFPFPSPTQHEQEGWMRRKVSKPALKGGQEGKVGDRGGQQLHC